MVPGIFFLPGTIPGTIYILTLKTQQDTLCGTYDSQQDTLCGTLSIKRTTLKDNITATIIYMVPGIHFRLQFDYLNCTANLFTMFLENVF